MIRRQARERREYIYRKSQEAQERQTYERKQKLKDALASGKQLPTELRKDAAELGKVMTMDESQAEPTTHIDDEYSRAGIMDPKIVITTSRDPSSKLLQFAKEMRLVFPNSTRINRGNYVVKELADACRANDVTDLVVLHEHRGVPDALIVSHFPHGPTLYFSLHNVGFTSKLGKRVMDTLRYLFPVPKPDATRVMTFANENDFISFRHHVFAKTSHKEVQLAEVGPRFEMKPYEIRLGTIEQATADKEQARIDHRCRSTHRPHLLVAAHGPPLVLSGIAFSFLAHTCIPWFR
ncbi:hypothetical protein OPQ81_006831 [Rhizoctonia solani]|nr:hypothetical protein OPQ81_006831 [Rhizoctonia solani]